MRAVMSAVVVLAIFPPVAALAAESAFCVSCEGPVAHYACAFDGTAADPNDASLKLLCITELAKSGKHALCSVDRRQPSPCPGDTKMMALPDGYQPSAPPATATEVPANAEKPAAGPAQAATQAATQAAPQPKPAGETAVAKPEAPPKTVQEMVEKGTSNTGKVLEKGGDTAVEAAKTTGSVIQNAGKAVGDAAKKTWTCITSLFGSC
jgi:hypothetical protein